MRLRSFRERVIQTIAFEIGGILAVTPIFAATLGTTAPNAFNLILTLSVMALVWSPLHNTAFDWAEFRLTGRLASDRPRRLRVVHAISHEVTVMVFTLPVVIAMTGLSVGHAVIADLGISAFYTLYALFFHVAYDRARPVRMPQAELAPWRGQAPKIANAG